MALSTVLLLALLTVAAGLAYQRRRDRFYFALAMVGAFAIIVGLVSGVEFSVRVDPLVIGLVAVVTVVAAEAFGLPEPLAVRLGFGVRSREWEYDRELTSLLHPLNQMIATQPDPSREADYLRWRELFLSEGERRLTTLRDRRAPTADWARLTASYQEIYARILELYRIGESPPLVEEINAMSRAADREREALRRSYRTAARELLRRSPTRRMLRDVPPRPPEDRTDFF